MKKVLKNLLIGGTICASALSLASCQAPDFVREWVNGTEEVVEDETKNEIENGTGFFKIGNVIYESGSSVDLTDNILYARKSASRSVDTLTLTANLTPSHAKNDVVWDIYCEGSNVDISDYLTYEVSELYSNVIYISINNFFTEVLTIKCSSRADSTVYDTITISCVERTTDIQLKNFNHSMGSMTVLSDSIVYDMDITLGLDFENSSFDEMQTDFNLCGGTIVNTTNGSVESTTTYDYYFALSDEFLDIVSTLCSVEPSQKDYVKVDSSEDINLVYIYYCLFGERHSDEYMGDWDKYSTENGVGQVWLDMKENPAINLYLSVLRTACQRLNGNIFKFKVVAKDYLDGTLYNTFTKEYNIKGLSAESYFKITGIDIDSSDLIV